MTTKLAAAIIAILGCHSVQDSPKVTALKSLVAALNSKDDGTIKKMLETTFAPSAASLDERLKRIKPLAMAGAPFTILEIGKEDRRSLRAKLKDKAGEELAWSLDFTEEGRIAGIRLLEPGEMDAPGQTEIRPWTKLSELATQIQTNHGVPGMSIAYYRDGNLAESTVVGVRNIETKAPALPEDVWSIGSISKTMTSTLVGKLIQDGKLEWNSRLGDLLKGIPMRPGYGEVTLLQLMRSRGGIPQDMNFTGADVRRILGDEKDPRARRQLYARDVLGREPIGKPGERFAYSNAGYALLGVVIERITGMTYEEAMKKLLFEPLGLTSAVVGQRGLPADRVLGYIREPKGLKQYTYDDSLPDMIAPAGSVRCTMRDLAAFGAMHLAALKGESKYLTKEIATKLHEGVSEGDGSAMYGCGWSYRQGSGRTGHNGSDGTFRAELAIFPKLGVAVGAVINCGGEYEPSPPLEAVIELGKKLGG